MNGNILSGYRIVNLTDDKLSMCAQLLADMGAKVTWVGKSPFTEAKDCLSLDIETSDGQRMLRKLVRNADILIESYPVGFLKTLGLDFPALSRINPRLIIASITPFGQTGPYKDFKSSELIASAMGGQMYVCGNPGQPPLKPFGPQAFFTAGLFAANGILLALWHRHYSNQGQYLDISIHECTAATLDHVLVRYFYEGIIPGRQGILYGNGAFRLFPCKDGYILLSLFYQWETLIEWLDSEGAAADLKDEKWLDESARSTNIEHIAQILEEWTRGHTVDELVDRGQLMHFPWARVASIQQVLNNPQLNARDFLVKAVDPFSGRDYLHPRAPYKLSF